MKPPADPAACPAPAEWLALVDDEIPEPRKSLLLGHLPTCPACSATVASLAGEWSAAEVASLRRARPGAATRELGERIAAAPPPVDVPEGVVPVARPTIPGFRDLVPVARGGMGIVYRATDEILGRTVAVKLLPGWRAAAPSALARARREALVLARIDHPGVVRVLSSGDVDGVPWIAMEWIEGPSLARRLAEGPLPPREAARIARELARAVARVHAEGIVHRDIKPDNVLLASGATAADPPLPKLVDFGLARGDDIGAAVTQSAGAIGTPSFMAPEQTGLDPALGPVGPATDIHGLGATLFCMLTGHAPYRADTARAALARAAEAASPAPALRAARVPADLRAIVENCLRRRPLARYGSASDLADDLARYLDGAPVGVRPAGPGERLLAWARRRPVPAALVAVALLFAAGGGGGAAYHAYRVEAAHARALAGAARARESFERLTDDTAERLLQHNATLDDADRDHLRAIRDDYRRWPLEPEVATALRFRLAGLRRVATIFTRLGQFTEVADTLGLALGVIDDLEQRGLLEPDDVVLRYELRRGLRPILAMLGRAADPLTATADEITALEARVAAEPALRIVLAATRTEQAALLEGQRRHAEAGPAFLRAEDELDAAAGEGPLTAAAGRLEIMSRINLATSAFAAGDPQRRDRAARRLVDRARAILADTAVDGDDRAAAVQGLLLGLTLRSEAALQRSDPREALDHADEIVAVAKAARARDPAKLAYVDEFVVASQRQFRCHVALGDPERGRATLDEAVAAAEEALEAEPEAFQRVRSLVMALGVVTEAATAAGDRPRALAAARRIVVVAGPWLPSAAVGAEARRFTLVALDSVAAALAALGRPAEAIEALERATELAPAERRPALAAQIDRLRAGPKAE